MEVSYHNTKMIGFARLITDGETRTIAQQTAFSIKAVFLSLNFKPQIYQESSLTTP